jgi:hypothetical protein
LRSLWGKLPGSSSLLDRTNACPLKPMPVLRTLAEVTAIDIVWRGPFAWEDVVENKNAGSDYGVYQIYGTHPLFGSDSLLYIGRTTEYKRRFSTRLAEHTWIAQEPRKISIYLGRLGSTSPLPDGLPAAEEWGEWIVIAEGILIFFCRPPRNSHGIQTCPGGKPVIVFNVGERNQLPSALSNLYLSSPALVDPNFRIFVERDAG